MGQPFATKPSISPAGSSRDAIAAGRVRFLTWLACAAFYFPLFWISTSLVWTAPALARAALWGWRLEGFSMTAFGASAASVPPGSVGNVLRHWTARSPFTLLVAVTIVIVAVALAAWLGKRARTLSGLAIAVLADVAFANGGRRLIESHRISPPEILSSLIFFSALCFGLRWMLSGLQGIPAEAAPPRVAGAGKVVMFLRRFAQLFAGFVVLPVLPWLWFSWARGWELWIFAVMLMAPAALAAIVASLGPVGPAAEPQGMTWRAPALGVAALALLVAGVNLGHAEIARARAAATRAAMAAYPALPPAAPYEKIFFQKGVSVSAEGWGGYESESGRRMLEALRRDGVNAVALVPYGFEARGRAEVRLNSGAGSWESDEGLEEMSRVAHALGMKVMLKPGVWVGEGGYAGDIEITSPAEHARWFESYTHFVEHYATLAKQIHADLFCVGGEFVKLTPDEAGWRKVIARARELYPGPLVYAANFGDEFETVKFWDALDYIGLQDYYPLPDDLATGDVVRKVEAVQRKFHRPVIFTEVGFASGEHANRTPWEDGHGKPVLELQARCYRAVFEAFYDKPWFEGMYWWKIGTDGFGGPDDTSLTPWGKPGMEVVKQWYSRARK
jgi:Glycoside Hydrolase Family 113